MIKIFIPEIKGKNKTSVRGFWRNAEGKIYYDYLKVKNTSYIEPKQLEALKVKYNQEAIAYIDTATECLKIYSSRNKEEGLYKHIIIEVCKQSIRARIKEALRAYGGVTVYIKDDKYLLEAFYND
jgi:hypothetical protein